jgi:hypothetical protein
MMDFAIRISSPSNYGFWGAGVSDFFFLGWRSTWLPVVPFARPPEERGDSREISRSIWNRGWGGELRKQI